MTAGAVPVGAAAGAGTLEPPVMAGGVGWLVPLEAEVGMALPGRTCDTTAAAAPVKSIAAAVRTTVIRRVSPSPLRRAAGLLSVGWLSTE
ncbi:MAG TPA: hypothetical protein VNH38_02075 [Candidatus Dormibacteraeota bacterium]|nr:hypothetical protein [Candidatus Dormibacteraeota bacterium]